MNDEVIEEEIDESEVDYTLTIEPPPASKIIMKAGLASVVIESTEPFDVIVQTARDLFKEVYQPDAERRAQATGFGSYERSEEQL